MQRKKHDGNVRDELCLDDALLGDEDETHDEDVDDGNADVKELHDYGKSDTKKDDVTDASCHDASSREKVTLRGAKRIWCSEAKNKIRDDYGYGRIPAFWFTLHLPFGF